MALKHFCGKQGCKALVDIGQRYCDKHKGADADRHQVYDQAVRYTKDKAYHDFYNSKEWKSIRSHAVRRDKGLCQECLMQGRVTLFDAVHHRLPIKTHWQLRLHLNNLVCLCNSHHQQAERELVRRTKGS